jgi:lysophospholipase L1-like esterase
MRRLCLVVVFAVACGVLAPRAAASPPVLAALGDSFSSGEGAPPFDSAAGRCHRSPLAWPVLVARSGGWDPRVLACSGAVIDDVARGQVSALAQLRDASLVTLTAGGNDAGFAAVLRDCALRWRCDRRFTGGGHDRVHERIAALAPRLSALLGRVRAASGRASVVAVGYPRLFPVHPGRLTCAALGLISAPEIRYLNDRTAELDRVIARAARTAGALYVDVLGALSGHGVSCRGVQWVNHLRLGRRRSWSFHPNAAGQRRLAEVVAAALGARGWGRIGSSHRSNR